MQKPTVLLLSAYPLSKTYMDSLRRRFGPELAQLTLAELREQDGSRLLFKLWSLKPDRLILPLEDENGTTLLPVTKLLAAFSRARSIEVLQPDGTIVSVSRLSSIADVARFGLASLACLVEALRAKGELRQLLSAAPQEVKPGPGKIMYLKTNLWFGVKAGGSIGHIAGVVNALQRGGHSVVFASAEAPVMVDETVDFRKVAPPRTFGIPYELNNYRFQRSFLRTASAILEKEKFSFIYQRLSAANYLGCLLARRFRLPLVVEYNGSEAWIAKNWGRGMRFHALAVAAEDAMLRHAHVVVTISDVLRDDLIARGVNPARIVTYPNCVDERVFNPDLHLQNQRDSLREEYGIARDAKLCAFIGTFGQWHGVDVLARAIVTLKQHHSEWLTASGLHFMLIGDGLKMKEVVGIIAEGGVQDLCTITGLVPQSQAPLYLATADMLTSPHVANTDGSKFFGSPTKLFEYMAMQKPIVASRLDQVGEVLSPGLDAADLPGEEQSPRGDEPYLALLAKPGDEEELARSIMFLADRPDWAALLARRSRDEAMAKYTWAHHVDRILAKVFA